MTREEAIKELKDFKDKSWDGMPEEVIDIAIEVLEQEPCDDCISRQAVLDYIVNVPGELTADGRGMIRRRTLEEYISDTLLPVTPQPKIGHWILTMPRGAEEWCYKCSECNFWKYKKTINLSKFKFCPNCGAKME